MRDILIIVALSALAVALFGLWLAVEYHPPCSWMDHPRPGENCIGPWEHR